MLGSGKILSDVTPNSDVDEDFLGDMGKRFVVAPQMDLAMFEFMRSNGKLEWFSSLCDKYYATCGDVTKMLHAVRAPVQERSTVVPQVEERQLVSKAMVVKPQPSPAWRRSQTSRKFDNRVVGPSVEDDNRYDFPNSGVVDAYGDGYCYLNLVRAKDIVAVANNLGPSPDLRRFFSLPSRNYIPVDFWRYRGVVIDQKGVHVSGSLGPDTFYGFALAVKHLFKDSAVLREVVGEVGEHSVPSSLADITPQTVIGKMVRFQPKLVYMVEDVNDLFDASYRFAASGVEVVGPDNEQGYKVDILLGSGRSLGVERVGSLPVKSFDVWKCHRLEQQYAPGFCYLLLFQSAYRDSLAKRLGKNPEWSKVLAVPARALEVPRRLATLRVQVGPAGVCHVGSGQGFDLRSFLAALVVGKSGLAVDWELDEADVDLPDGCDETSKVGFVTTESGVALRELYVVQSSSDLLAAAARFSKPGTKILTLNQAKRSEFVAGVVLRSSNASPSDRLGLPPAFIDRAHADWTDHRYRTEYGDGYCYLHMFKCSERDRLLSVLGAYPTWRDIARVSHLDLVSDSQLRALKVLKLGLYYHVGEFGVPILQVICDVRSAAYKSREDLAMGWPTDNSSAGFWGGFSLDSEVGVADLGAWLREFSPELTSADAAIVSSSAALLGPVDRVRLRMLEAVGDAAITVHIAMEVARSAGTAEQYQNRRSSSASNANLSRLFNACPEMAGCVKFAGGVNPATGVVGAKAFEAIVGAVALSGGASVVSKFLAQFAI